VAEEMNTCQWCGDTHPADRLCQRASKTLTRRSFCFLFGAGIIGTALIPPVDYLSIDDYDYYIKGIRRIGPVVFKMNFNEPPIPIGNLIQITFGKDVYRGTVREARFTDDGISAVIDGVEHESL